MKYRVTICICFLITACYVNTGHCELLTYQIDGQVNSVIWSLSEGTYVSDAARQAVSKDVSAGMDFNGSFSIDSEYLDPDSSLPDSYFAEISYSLLLESGLMLQVGDRDDLQFGSYENSVAENHTQKQFFLGGRSIENDPIGGFDYQIEEGSVDLNFSNSPFFFDSGSMFITGWIAGSAPGSFGGYLLIGADIGNFYEESTVPTPEPMTIILYGIGLVGVYSVKRRKKLNRDTPYSKQQV